MQYRTGQIGRVILARFDHGEAIVPALAGLCRAESVRAGWFFLLGAARGGRLVCGPKEEALPPDPDWRAFAKPFEIVGMGSVAEKDGAPSLHLHAALGRGQEVLTGCIRKEGDVFVVVEALIVEVAGVTASREPDEKTGLELISLA